MIYKFSNFFLRDNAKNKEKSLQAYKNLRIQIKQAYKSQKINQKQFYKSKNINIKQFYKS